MTEDREPGGQTSSDAWKEVSNGLKLMFNRLGKNSDSAASDQAESD